MIRICDHQALGHYSLESVSQCQTWASRPLENSLPADDNALASVGVALLPNWKEAEDSSPAK